MAGKSQRKKNVLSSIHTHTHTHTHTQFINTLNFTGIPFIKRVTKHVSYLKIKNNTEGKTVYLTKGTSPQYYFLPLYS